MSADSLARKSVTFRVPPYVYSYMEFLSADAVENEDGNRKALRPETVPAGVSSRRYARLRQGYQAYVRDLPQLLKENHEGQMVAYLGNAQIGIAPTNNELHKTLSQNPKYTKRMKDVLVKRVTILDADELGLQF
jgi:hypothetical protein